MIRIPFFNIARILSTLTPWVESPNHEYGNEKLSDVRVIYTSIFEIKSFFNLEITYVLSLKSSKVGFDRKRF